MTTVTMETGTASAAILTNEGFATSQDEKFPYPTLEPGFDLLSEDWFQQKNLNLTNLSQEVMISNHFQCNFLFTSICTV